MATAVVTEKTVTKNVEIEEKVYDLRLSEREAEVLYGLLSRVNGSLSTSYRKETGAVRDALGRVGIYAYGAIYFEGLVTANDI